MEHNTNTEKDFSRGCPLSDPVDGDIAEQEDQTVLCPEANSIKDYVNDPPGGGVVGRETPILSFQRKCQTKKFSHNMAGSPAYAGIDRERQSPRSQDLTLPGSNDLTLRCLNELQEKKRKYGME